MLNLGGGDANTHTLMVFTVMAALAPMELGIKHEKFIDSVTKRRAVGKNFAGHRPTFGAYRIRNAMRLPEAGEAATQLALDLGNPRVGLYRRIREMLLPAAL